MLKMTPKHGCRSVLPFVTILIFLMAALPAAAELVTTAKDQTSVSLTIYNSDLALVRDARNIRLLNGEQTLAFKEVSSFILPQTALIKGNGIDVIEQNFEFDLLTPTSLLNKYVGRQVTLVKENKKTGVDEHVPATVLSTAQGVVLKVGNQIETTIPGRLIFPDVPTDLREKPTLTMQIQATKTSTQNLELFYLTKGLSWKADYVAQLNKDDNRLDIKGWVTLTNNCGTSFEKAKLQLVAGDVNQAKPEMVLQTMADGMSMPARAAKKSIQQEAMFEYHLYSINRPVTIKNKQSKQIALLDESNGICKKQLVLRTNNTSYYWRKVGEISKKKGLDVFLEFKNDKKSNFGLPKPAGIVRVYKKDSAGFSQFIGEDRIDHTPENETIKIKLGKSFDVTADRIQTDFTLLKKRENNTRVYESAYEIVLKNAKDKKTVVTVEETLPGDWQILKESIKHKKETATMASWKLTIPAKGSKKLTYKVRIRM